VATEGTWRKKIFKKGKKYRVLKDWAHYGNGPKVKTGEILEFESCAYERYDNLSLYRFYLEKDPFVWLLHDNDPESKAHEYFEPFSAK